MTCSGSDRGTACRSWTHYACPLSPFVRPDKGGSHDVFSATVPLAHAASNAFWPTAQSCTQRRPFCPFSEQAAGIRARRGFALVLICWDNVPFLHENDLRLAARKRTVRDAAGLLVAVTEAARQALNLEKVRAKRSSYSRSASTAASSDLLLTFCLRSVPAPYWQERFGVCWSSQERAESRW